MEVHVHSKLSGNNKFAILTSNDAQFLQPQEETFFYCENLTSHESIIRMPE